MVANLKIFINIFPNDWILIIKQINTESANKFSVTKCYLNPCISMLYTVSNETSQIFFARLKHKILSVKLQPLYKKWF